MPQYHSASGSAAEDLFIDLFADAFGAEKAGYLYSQYHFYDIYQNSRYADFVLENGPRRVAIEIDDEGSHNKQLVAAGKFYDDLLKQNSMVHLGWDVYRWAVRQMQTQPDLVKDELRVFLGNHPQFREIEDYLPAQRGKALDGTNLELKEHQKAALKALEAMRDNSETIALLYHATGTGKTTTAVLDAKRCGGRVLFIAHTQELVDIFNWQEEAAGMISQMEFVRRVDVQTETIERYVREGKLIPDLVVPMSEHRTFKYFKEETLEKYAKQYGWRLIDDSNRKDLFMEMIRQMDMSYSCKPVLIKAILLYADKKGMVKLSDIVAYFRSFYEGRRAVGLPVEKKNSIFAKGGYTDADVKRNILANPFKRFEDMQMLRHTKTLGIIQVEETVWKHLSAEEKDEIGRVCGEKLEAYYSRLK